MNGYNMNPLSSPKQLSIALINAYPLYTGSTAAVLDYYRALKDLGYSVVLYQLVIPGTSFKYPEPAIHIRGRNFFVDAVNLPMNVLFTMPGETPNIEADIIILTDPVILTLKVKFPDSIVIFHDLREFGTFSQNPARKLFFIYLARFLRDNDKVIASSNFTKEMIQLHIKRDLNIRVVELCSSIGINQVQFQDKLAKHQANPKNVSVLYIAADRPYKNIKLFIKVAQLIDKMNLDIDYNFRLVSKLRRSNRKALMKEKPSNLVVIEHVDELDLLYREADVLLFPSKVEGFGLPLAEAMSYGVPIIYSSRPPMTDIVGNFGIAVDPETPELWVRELLGLSAFGTYEKMARLSYERSKNYSYERFKANVSRALKSFF